MSPAHNYKKLENKLIEKLIKFFHLIGSSCVSFFRFLIQKGKQRFTVMFIPHSEKKIVNFHISIFSLIFIGVLLVVLVVAFFGFSTYFAGAKTQYDNISRELELNKSSLEKFDEEIKHLVRSSESVKNGMKELFQVFEKNGEDFFSNKGLGGDLQTMRENNNPDFYSSRLNELREMRNYWDRIQPNIQEIIRSIERQKELLISTPNRWPVISDYGIRVGRITSTFGPEMHPFKRNFRLHNGIDIAYSRGTRIIATANGTIENIGYAVSGLGHYIVIRHEKYGFKTKYGHLEKILVNRGKYVKQGDIIGYMGSSGLSTGPHLHYEVWIGEQVVDPMQYLEISR